MREDIEQRKIYKDLKRKEKLQRVLAERQRILDQGENLAKSFNEQRLKQLKELEDKEQLLARQERERYESELRLKLEIQRKKQEEEEQEAQQSMSRLKELEDKI